MTDEQFRALRTLILDAKVEIAGLALAIRTMQRQLDALTVDNSEYSEGETTSNILTKYEFEALLRTRQSRGPHNGSE